jgi:pimeloyl-ACP methyl ester carboxylesterase
MPTVEPRSRPTFVLVHGAGHTSQVWTSVQSHLQYPSLAVDLPGRRDRPGDITRLTIAEAADSAFADVRGGATPPLILVGHSSGGIVLPALASRLGARVVHLVFVAGLSARDGDAVIDTVSPGRRDAVLERLAEMREQHGGRMLDPQSPDSAPALHDERVAMSIESLNLMTQAVSWDGVQPGVERTFVRCLRDRIQPRAMQAKLAENCGATSVVDLDSGHTPARATPGELARVLDEIGRRMTRG